MRDQTNHLMQSNDLIQQLDFDRPRLLARNRRILTGAVGAWVTGVVMLGYGAYQLLSAL